MAETESWVAGFNEALLKFLNANLHGTRIAVEIIDYSESSGRGCDTCGPEVEVDFRYKCGDKGCDLCKPHMKAYPNYIRGHLYNYWGSFGGIIEVITS